MANAIMTRYELYRDAGEIPYGEWREEGIRIPIFDKSGTLSNANSMDCVESVIAGLKAQQLPDIYRNIALVSNDYDTKQVAAFGSILRQKLGVHVFTVSREDGPGTGYRRKPYADMGFAVAREFGFKTSQLGVIGDRWATDVLFGRNLRAGAVALCDKAGTGDARFVPGMRVLEAGIVGVACYLGFATRH